MESLKLRGYRPNARLGQNFLFDPNVLEAFLEDANVVSGETILEVGPGAGTLTERMLARGCRVLAAEIDSRLCEHLRAEFAEPLASGQLTLWEGDALQRKSSLHPELEGAIAKLGAYRLVANLPYAIATPLLHGLLALQVHAQGSCDMLGVAVLLQKEMAERWVAPPGGGDYGPTAATLHYYGEGRITRRVGRKLFIPPPKVDSAFLVWSRLRPLDDSYLPFVELGRRLFSQRRKMLRALLKGELEVSDRWWGEHGVDPQARPEVLSPEQLVSLSRRLS